MGPADLPPPVELALVDYVAERCQAAQVEVRYLGVDVTSLPASAQWLWEGDPCRSRPVLRLSAVEHGLPVRQVQVRPSLRIFVDAPVAAYDVRPGELVEVVPGTVSLHGLVGSPVEQGPWKARVALRQGDPITHLVVEAPAHTTAGSPVVVRLSRGALQVETEGELMQDARIGEQVRVATRATHTMLRGVLVDPETVEVR